MEQEHLTFSRRLAFVIQGLFGKIAYVAARDSAITPLLALVTSRLQRMVRQLERLVDRWRAGKLRQPRPYSPRKPRQPREKPTPGTLTLPSGHGWLLNIAQETAQYYYHVELLLSDPELVQILREVPQARRILRPLFRGLNINPLPEPMRPPEPPPRAARPARRGPATAAPPPKARPPKLRLWRGPRLKNAVSLW